MTLLRGRMFAGGRSVDDGVVVLAGDRIAYAGPVADWTGPHGALPPPDRGRWLLPGLVDGHCHGGGGGSFPDDDLVGVRRAVQAHRRTGTTALVASLVSAAPEVLRERLALLVPLVAAGELAGLHLEGPFLAAARCGAQDPQALRPGDPGLLDELLTLGAGTVRAVTVAPETAYAAELVAVCRRHGAVPAVGHTAADAATTAALLEADDGPFAATHLFNGMPPLLARAPGPVAACLAAAARGRLVVELVADGVHLAAETVAMVFGLVGPDGVALVSDAMAAAGVGDGEYRLGRSAVTVTGGVARLAAGRPEAPGSPGPLAGGTARLLDVLRRTVRDAGVPPEAAVAAASRTPARLLGLPPGTGDLVTGGPADVLVTDDRLYPLAVYARGRPVEPAVPSRRAG